MDTKTKKPTLSPQSARRMIAGELLMKDYEIDEVMDITGASLSAVKRWKKVIRNDGFAALARQGNSGNTTRLSEEQREQLRKIIVAGAVASGFENECWTAKRIAKIILEKFGVSYHFRYVARLLRAMKISYQTPDIRAKKHSQEAVDQWIKTDWPRIKKNPKNSKKP